ncbi:MAG: bifunctional 4-hydroxy-2-oxoglutarate aldolase/2-dehydro-3-deoxy-phosphogluconate aldolase [Geminicoccaceae bacterium]
MPVGFEQIERRIAAGRLLPVVVVDDAAQAVPLARALLAGGLPVAEVTFRTDAAAEAIRRIADAVPEVLLGAGTVLSPAQVRAARAAGAMFLVTPGFNPAVVQAAADEGLPIVPGINNPSGVEQAMAAGLSTVKFFPAEPSGGVAFLKALTGPYAGMRFVPTGGIGPRNLRDYLALPAVLACGGSWMVEASLVRAGRFDEVARLTAEAVALAKAS